MSTHILEGKIILVSGETEGSAPESRERLQSMGRPES
jgi:hypothetical protein